MNKNQANPIHLQASWKKRTLEFKFEAGTSRGVLNTKDSYFIQVFDPSSPLQSGWGEAGPLPNLSVDDVPDLEAQIEELVRGLAGQPVDWTAEGVLRFCRDYIPESLPSVRFAFETALLDLFYGGEKVLFPNSFVRGQLEIPINGLIWMGKKDFMLQQIQEKLDQGYSCIKMKIGAIDFQQECELLGYIRKRFSADQITLRVDANGAFKAEDALEKLEALAQYELHSIEQPIRQGQEKEMAALCKVSPIPIALDEELIGVSRREHRERLLDTLLPPYIILKPSLVGGIYDTREWIGLAEERGIAWWMTSALESNIGLNAITQLAASYPLALPQGLGTGQLYHNNIDSPLCITNGNIHYTQEGSWGQV